MPVFIFLEYSDNYLNTYGSLWQYYRDNAGDFVDFNGANHNSQLFKYKQKITDATDANGAKNVEIMLPLKYLSSFRKTLELPLTNCEYSNLIF